MNKLNKNKQKYTLGDDNNMEHSETITDALAVGLGAIYGHFTNLDYKSFFVLLMLMFCDIIIGVLFAIARGDFASYDMKKGLIDKALLLILLFSLTIFQIVLNEIGVVPPFANMVVAILSFMEIFSILETFAEHDVALPKKITQWFRKEYDKLNNDEEK